MSRRAGALPGDRDIGGVGPAPTNALRRRHEATASGRHQSPRTGFAPDPTLQRAPCGEPQTPRRRPLPLARARQGPPVTTPGAGGPHELPG